MPRGPLHIDVETRSACDLLKAGAHRYAEDPTTEIILFRYCFGKEPTKGWRKGQPIPQEIVDHIEAGGEVVGHNQQFERLLLNHKLFEKPLLKARQQNCTLARAAAMSLPLSLYALGLALKIEQPKDVDGHRLMMLMCKPSHLTADGRPVYRETPAMLDGLDAYCTRDVLAEHEIDAHLPPLSERERRVWELDQLINDRGVQIDIPLVQAAQDAVTAAKRQADRQMWEVTGGAVSKATQAEALADWINSRGIPCTSIADGEIDELLVGADLLEDDPVAKALRIRRSAAGAFKFEAMLRTVCRDGRVRGSLAYHGAHSGRWAGRGMQPQNFKRMETDEDVAMVQAALPLLKSKDPLTAIDTLVGPPLEVLSLCARSMIIAAPGKKLVSGDFTNIEGRLNAWFAGQADKLQAFREYDAGTGPDLYKVTAAQVLEKDVSGITRPERQLHGKVPELACGYQGGVAAFQKMGAKNGISIADSHASRIIRGWRAVNPMIVQSWADLQEAAIKAVEAKGAIVSCLNDKVRYVYNGDFLFCRIPSGRVISYAAPRLSWKKKIVTIDGEEVELNRFGLSYWGVKSGRWMQIDLYGGSQCAHVVSGMARDLLVEAMFTVEAAGYPVVLSVHDELVSEVDETFGSAEEYERLMSEAARRLVPGMPLATKAWEDVRYVK